MRIREASKSDGAWFVPDVGDNRQVEDPFKVFITPMTYAEKRRLEVETLGDPIRKKAESFLSRAHRFQDELFERHVLKVEGYGIRRASGEIFAPRNGRELLAALLEGEDAEAEAIVSNVLDAIRDSSSLAEGVLGKSASPQPSTSPGTTDGGSGVAVSAKVMAS